MPRDYEKIAREFNELWDPGKGRKFSEALDEICRKYSLTEEEMERLADFCEDNFIEELRAGSNGGGRGNSEGE